MSTRTEATTIQIVIIAGAGSGEFEAIVDNLFPGALAISASDVQSLGLVYTSDIQACTTENGEVVEIRESPVFLGFNDKQKAFFIKVVSSEFLPKVGRKFLEAFDYR